MNIKQKEQLEAEIAWETDDEQLQLWIADRIGKLLNSRERWRRVALLCATLLAAFVVMFAISVAKLP
jgi:hypothetical protein